MIVLGDGSSVPFKTGFALQHTAVWHGEAYAGLTLWLVWGWIPTRWSKKSRDWEVDSTMAVVGGLDSSRVLKLTRRGQRLILALHVPNQEWASLAGDVPVAIGGSSKRKDRGRLECRGWKTDSDFCDHCRKHSLAPDFDFRPFTAGAGIEAIGNGLPLALGPTVARGVPAAFTDVRGPA